MDFVGVDIGASQTRVISQTARIGVLPNNAVFMEGDVLTNLEPYDNELENTLEVYFRKVGQSSIFPLHMLYGTMAERQSRLNIRPSVQENKYKQPLSYASILLAAAASRIQFHSPEKLKLYIAVPPVEVKKAEEAFKEELVGDFEVYFPKYSGGLTVRLSIYDVVCKEESFMASVSYFFDLTGNITPEAKPFMSSNILSINIGASTTDLAVIKNGKYLEKSGKTIPVGGNIARDYLIGAVADRYGFDLPIDKAEEAMMEGRLKIGAVYEDIRDIVSDAKDILAREIVSKLEYYFKSIGMPIQIMEAIIVSGGGSMRSQYIENGEVIVTSEPMSTFVTEKLSGWCPNIKVVPHGDEARLADVKGLYIVAHVDELKENAANSTLAMSKAVEQNANQQTTTAQPVQIGVQTAPPVI